MDGHGGELGDSAPYGRIEYAYSEMAKAAGVDMMPCQLLAEGPRRHFMTKRFDRGPDGERFHVLSLCGMANLDYNLIAAPQLRPVFPERQRARPRARRDGGGVPADGLQRHGGEPRRPHQELRLPAERRRRLAPLAGLRRHACLQPGEPVDQPSPDVGQRQIRCHRVSRTSTSSESATTCPATARSCARSGTSCAEWPTFAAGADVDDETTKAIATDIERFAPR